MKNHRFLLLPVLLGAALMASCGDPRITLGKTISGSLTKSDNYWVDYDSSTHAATDAGYSDDYQVQVTKGTSYTVTFWSSTGRGVFEDKDGGRFHWSDGGAGSSLVLSPSNPQTVQWVPAVTGLTNVDVYCATGDVPLNYTVQITQ